MYRVIRSNGRNEIREYAPAYRTLVFNQNEEDSAQYDLEFTVPFPTMLFAKHLGYDDLFIAFALKPIETVDDLVYCPPIPNLYHSWNMCGCNSRYSLERSIQRFWGSKFNLDGGTGHRVIEAMFGNFPPYGLSVWASLSLEKVIERLKEASDKIHYSPRPFWMFATHQTPNEPSKPPRKTHIMGLDLNAKYPESKGLEV